MTKVNLKKAANQLDALVQAACLGEEVILTRDDQPVARLVGIPSASKPRKAGSAKGLIHIAKNFDAPIADLDEYSR